MQSNQHPLNMRTVKKPEDIKDLGLIDTSPLFKLLSEMPEKVWSIEDKHKENTFSVFHSTQHIVFRFIENFADPRQFYTEPSWRMWSAFIQPTIDEIANRYHYTNPVFPKVMLAKLRAGCSIDKHTDKGQSNQYVHKIHVPIVTHPNVRFFEKDRSFFLEKGHAYEVNNLIPHGVINNSEIDRVHLIFEMFNLDS